MGRISAAAKAFKADRVLQLLGDNPLLDASLVDAVVEHLAHNGYDYAVNLTNEFPEAAAERRRFAIGVRVEAMPIETLLRCDERAKTTHYREHATSYIGRHPEEFRVGYLEAEGRWRFLNRPDWTFAVNYAENLELIRRIVSESGGDPVALGLEDVVAILKDNRGLVDLMGEPTPSGGDAPCPA